MPQWPRGVKHGAHAKWKTRRQTQMDQYKSQNNARMMRMGSHGTSSAPGTLCAATTVANARHARSARAGVSHGVRGRLEGRSAERKSKELALWKRYAALAMASSALIVAYAKPQRPRNNCLGSKAARIGAQAKSIRKSVIKKTLYALGIKSAPGVQESAQNAISAQLRTQLAQWVPGASWAEQMRRNFAANILVAPLVAGRTVHSRAGIAPIVADKRFSLQRNHATQICHLASSKAKVAKKTAQTV